MCRQINALGASTAGLLTTTRPTVEKVRLLGSSEDRTAQQMIRLDIEETGPVDEETEGRLFDSATLALDDAKVMCLEGLRQGRAHAPPSRGG